MSQSIVDDIDTSLASNAKIKVIGVGGGGGNAVEGHVTLQSPTRRWSGLRPAQGRRRATTSTTRGAVNSVASSTS